MKNTKKLFLFALAVMLFAVVFCFSASALEETGQCGENVYWSYNSESGKLVIEGTGDMYDYDYATSDFYGWGNEIVSVIIEYGVTSIGDYAFQYCNSLTSLTISESVTRIGESAFSYCLSLEKITVLNNELDISTLPSSAMLWCYKNSAAHTYCVNNNRGYVLIDGTESENKPSGTIGKFTWNLDKETGVLKISGAGALPSFGDAGAPWKEYNKYITTIEYADGITALMSQHNSYSNLKTVIIPESVTSIDASAFSNCNKLESINIPDSVTSIGSSAFRYCSSLESVTIPDSVTSIGDYAFYNCTSLKSVTIPDSVTSIGSSAFEFCSNIKNVYISDLSAWCNIWTLYYYDYWIYCFNNPLRYGADLYLNGNLVTDLVIPSDVTSIGDYAFYGCTSLESVTIPESVTNIGSGAFCYCKNLENVTIGRNVKTIGSSAFNGCSSLETLTIPYSVKSIDSSVLPSTLKEIYVYSKDCSFASDCGLNYTHTIYGFKGSTAEAFADDKATTFKDIEEIHEHKEEIIPGKAATCTEKGLTEGKKCSEPICSKVIVAQTETPALGHKEEPIVGNPATCTATGLTEGKKCTTCGTVTVSQTEIPATGHKEEVIPGKPATCTETGLTEGKKCSTCGAITVAQENIAATGHKEETIPGKTATCTETGLTEGKKCSTCGKITVEQKVIPALGHKEATLKAVKATYTKTGLTEGKKCSECDEILEEQKKVARKKIGKVKSLKVKTTKTTSVKLSWKKVVGAEGYKVYYSTNGKKWKTVKTTKNSVTVKKLTSGTSYQFKVKAVAGKYEGSASSVVKTATKVSKPTVKSVKSSKAKQAVVFWNKVNGADGYVIEYSSSKKFTKKTTKKVTVKKGKTTKTTLKKLKRGKKYYVRVKAYRTENKKTVYGAYSSAKAVKVK